MFQQVRFWSDEEHQICHNCPNVHSTMTENYIYLNNVWLFCFWTNNEWQI